MSRVFVLGNAAIDLTLRVPTFPVGGETLIAIDRTRGPGGKGLNQAVAASRTGIEVVFRAAIGRDPDGDELQAALAGEALRFEPLRVDAPTDLSTVMVTPDGENCIATAGDAAAAFPPEEAAAFARRTTPNDWLLLQGNLRVAATVAALRSGPGSIALNASPIQGATTGMLAWCSLVVTNEIEARSLTGTEPATAANVLCELGAAAAIVTLGGAGALLAEATEGVRHFPAFPADVIDTTGAGDTLCGVLVARRATGMAWEVALAAAQEAAAIKAAGGTRTG